MTREEMYCALEERHGAEFQKKLSETSVAVCGLGGLGSNIATALARMGVGRLHLIDFDKVDITNLHRQQYFPDQLGQPKIDALGDTIRRIAPYIEVVQTNIRLDSGNICDVLSGDDIICEAMDNADSKAELVNCVLEKMPEKYLICGSGMAGISDANEITTRRITDRFFVCGDGRSDVNDGIGLTATRVMVCAAHQAHKIVQIIRGTAKGEE